MVVPPPPSGGAAVLAGFQMIAAFQVGHPDFSSGQWSLELHMLSRRVGSVPALVARPRRLSLMVKAKALRPASMMSCDACRLPWPLLATMERPMRASWCSHRSHLPVARGRTALSRCASASGSCGTIIM